MSKTPAEPLKQSPITPQVLIPKIINGGIAGIIGVSVVFPLDLVKTRLQNQTIGPNGEKQYKNMFDCFRKTYRAEGYFGMYRGSAVNILLVTPEKAVKFACNDVVRMKLALPDGSITMPNQMIAGGMAGGCQALITTPMELLKIQMQDAGRVEAEAKARGGTKVIKRQSSWQLTKKLIGERGITGLYKGFRACAIRDVLWSLIYFPMFAGLSKIGKKPGEKTPPFWRSFSAGCVSGATAAISVTPFDVVKTRMQTLVASGDRQYSSVIDCITKIMKHEGPTAFFKGGACRMIVIAPLYGIAQTVYYYGIAEYLLGYKRTTII